MGKYEYIEKDNINPDWQNYSNTLFVQWEEMNNAFTNYENCERSEEKTYLKMFNLTFVRFFGQINDKYTLGHFTKKEKEYIIYFYKHINLINKISARKINETCRKLLTEYGLFKMNNNNDEW